MARKVADVGQTLIEKINKEFGEGTLVRASDTRWVESPKRVSCGSLGLDLATGGGFPRGRITHIYGSFSSAKTSLAYGALREAQKAGGKAAIVVIEEFDKQWALDNGLDLERLDLAFPESANEAVDILEQLVRTDEYDVVVYDSIGANAALALLERSATQADLTAIGARLNTQLLARLAAALNSKTRKRLNQTAVILLNQMRISFENSFVIQERPAGGKALGFHTSVGIRLGFRKSDDVKDKEDSFFGRMADDGEVFQRRRINFLVEKNKTFRPLLSGHFWFAAKEQDGCPVGIDQAEEAVRLGVLCGLVTQSGAWLDFPSTPGFEPLRAQGQENACSALRKEPERLEALRREIFATVLAAERIKQGLVSPVLPTEATAISTPGSDLSLEQAIERGLVERRGPAWYCWRATGEAFRRADWSTFWKEHQSHGLEEGAAGGAEAEAVADDGTEAGGQPAERARPGRKARRAEAAGER